MSWTPEQEEIILDLMMTEPEHQGVMLQTLKSGKNKKHFSLKSDRSIISKARQLSYEALAGGWYAPLPEPAPKAKKPTKAELRAAMFARKAKMDPKIAGRMKTQAMVKHAKEKLAARAAAAEKSKATKNADKTEKGENSSQTA